MPRQFQPRDVLEVPTQFGKFIYANLIPVTDKRVPDSSIWETAEWQHQYIVELRMILHSKGMSQIELARGQKRVQAKVFDQYLRGERFFHLSDLAYIEKTIGLRGLHVYDTNR